MTAVSEYLPAFKGPKGCGGESRPSSPLISQRREALGEGQREAQACHHSSRKTEDTPALQGNVIAGVVHRDVAGCV